MQLGSPWGSILEASVCQLHITEDFTLGAREEAMGEVVTQTAAVKIDDVSALG